MTNALVVRSIDDVERAALAMSKSGYFADAAQQAQAIVKILAGQELGFGAFASMTGVHIIQGKPTFSANLMAAAVKRSGKYNYRIREITDTVCEIEFFEDGKPAGISRFTVEDAKRAGTKNLDKYPRNMLFARAMSNGVRWFAPDIFGGTPAYTPEELGAETDEDGTVTVIPGKWQTKDTAAPQPEPVLDLRAAWKSERVSYDTAASTKTSGGIPYTELDADRLPHMRNSIMAKIEGNADMLPLELEELKFKLDVIDAILEAKGA